MVLGPLDGADTGFVRHHQAQHAVGQLPPLLAVDEGLEVGAAAGDQDSEARPQHRTTRSSPWAISPMR